MRSSQLELTIKEAIIKIFKTIAAIILFGIVSSSFLLAGAFSKFGEAETFAAFVPTALIMSLLALILYFWVEIETYRYNKSFFRNRWYMPFLTEYQDKY